MRDTSLRRTWPALFSLFLAPPQAMADALQFYCQFDQECTSPDGCSSSDMQFVFQFDDLTHDAFIIGNNGLGAVRMIQGTEGITFFEELSSGALQTTTVTTTMPNTGTAVHSRHSIVAGILVPSQYLGRCTLSKANG